MEISAVMVKELRDKTGLGMMQCKKALQESGGDEQKAIETLRKEGIKTQEMKADRATTEGRFGIYTDFGAGVGAMIELQCESAPVASHEESPPPRGAILPQERGGIRGAIHDWNPAGN